MSEPATPEHGEWTTVPNEVIRCDLCWALVLPDDLPRHTNWHGALREALVRAGSPVAYLYGQNLGNV